jgi:nucleoside-diphosphate-sugar epimerase
MENPVFINDVVNIGNDDAFTILDLARIIIKATGSASKIVHLPPLPEGDMTRRQPDIANMKKLLNRPFTPLEEGLVKVVEARKKILNIK